MLVFFRFFYIFLGGYLVYYFSFLVECVFYLFRKFFFNIWNNGCDVLVLVDFFKFDYIEFFCCWVLNVYFLLRNLIESSLIFKILKMNLIFNYIIFCVIFVLKYLLRYFLLEYIWFRCIKVLWIFERIVYRFLSSIDFI